MVDQAVACILEKIDVLAEEAEEGQWLGANFHPLFPIPDSKHALPFPRQVPSLPALVKSASLSLFPHLACILENI